MSSKALAAVIIYGTLLPAQTPVLKLYEAVEPHMGTMFQIKLYAGDDDSAKAGFHAAFQRIAELDSKLSDYKPDSELNVAARHAAGRAVHISDDLTAVLSASQKMSEETEGAFDITVGPLTKLWRQARKEHRVPSSEAIREARTKCGYRKLHLNLVQQTITVDSPDVQLDLGAIAKGYAADEALRVLTRLGLQHALVAASGDLAFGDAPPGQAGWRIGIDSFEGVMQLTNAAVSTSGASEQNLESNGTRYSHIIDPKTGMGLTDDITVTTISRRGLLADPAATAISVLGCEKGMAFVERNPDLAAFIVEKSGGHVTTLESARFKKLEEHDAVTR